jgi:hypothetical protein
MKTKSESFENKKTTAGTAESYASGGVKVTDFGKLNKISGLQ